MKKIFSPFLLLLATACSLSHHTVTVGVLTLPARPDAGQRIKIRYKMDSIELANKKKLQLTLYYTVKDKIYAVPLAIQQTGNRVKAFFILPDSAQSFALRAQARYRTVRKMNGYISPIYDHAGKPVAGALAGAGLFYTAIGENNIGSSLLSRPVDADTALTLMRTDFDAYPEIKHGWMNAYLNTLLTARKQAAYPDIEHILQQMLAPDKVQSGDYATAYNLFLRMDMWDKADSVMAVGARKFPEGLMAKHAAESRFYFLQGSVDSMIAHYQRFKQLYPAKGVLSACTKIQDRMLAQIASHYAELGDYQKFMAYISLTQDPVFKADEYSDMARDLFRTGKAIPFADSISKMALDLIKQAMSDPEQGRQSYQTGRDREKELQQVYAGYADAYASQLNKEGKIKDAVPYEKDAVAYLNAEDPFTNEHYMEYLMDVKDYKTAQNELEKFITNGESTDKMDNYLKPLYIHLHNSQKGYTDYYRKLEGKLEAYVRAGVPREMIDKPAPDFTLPSLKGKEVSLAALKGKVVILDLWATWCGPCKASFPGMQQVVDDYKNDTNVVFLFVDTDEVSSPEERHKAISDFITNHSYRFHVLLDQRKAGDSTHYQLVNDYQVDGIPTKFIIDPKGDIKFISVGYYASTPVEVNEVSRMIEMAAH